MFYLIMSLELRAIVIAVALLCCLFLGFSHLLLLAAVIALFLPTQPLVTGVKGSGGDRECCTTTY